MAKHNRSAGLRVDRRAFLGAAGATGFVAASAALPTLPADAAPSGHHFGSTMLLKNGMAVDALGVHGVQDVLLANRSIKAIGRNLHADSAMVIDCTGKIVTPLWTDPHVHGWEYPFTGLADQMGFGEYIGVVTQKYLDAMWLADVAYAEFANLVEALNQGIGTVGMWCHGIRNLDYALAILEYASKVGLRAMFMYGYDSTKFPVGAGPNLDDVLKALKFAKTLPGIAGFGLALPGYEFTPFEVYKQQIEFARTCLGPRPLVSEHAGIPGYFNPAALQKVVNAGLVLSGHNMVHSCAYGPEQFKMLAGTKANIVTSPLVDSRVFGGVPYDAATAAGLNVSVSSDDVAFAGGQLNDHLAALATWQQGHADPKKPALIGDTQQLATVTTLAQRALGQNGGLLVPGAAADVMVVEPRGPLYAQNAVGHVVRRTSESVDTVILDGKVRKHRGQLLDFDIKEIRAKAAAIAMRVLAA